jgi:hypothetical protein
MFSRFRGHQMTEVDSTVTVRKVITVQAVTRPFVNNTGVCGAFCLDALDKGKVS